MVFGTAGSRSQLALGGAFPGRFRESQSPTGKARGGPVLGVAEAPIADIDVSDPDLWAERYPTDLFARLRAEDPVHWSEMTAFEDEGGYWSITKAEHLTEVSKDYETFSSGQGGIVLSDNGMPLDLQRHQFISMDPPGHTRLKQVFQRVFTPKMIATREPVVRAAACDALDAVEAEGSCDLVQTVGEPVVARVIASLLGTPPEMDPKLIEWGQSAIGFDDSELCPDPRPEHAYEVVSEVLDYVLPLVRDRVADPQDDLLSRLANAEIEGEPLTELELATIFVLLLAAGTDSTKSVYTNGMKALMESPDQRQLLLDDPSAIPVAVEEVLRCFPAFAHMRRTVTRDVDFHGAQMRAGDKLALWYVSGNRDEDVYEDPERFDVTRDPKHQAFGAGGRHFCLGAALARLELKVLLEETLSRFPTMEIDGEPVRTRSNFLNQYKHLPIRASAA